MTSKSSHRLCFQNKLAICTLHPSMLHWHLYCIARTRVWWELRTVSSILYCTVFVIIILECRWLASSFVAGWTKNCDVLIRQWLDIYYVFIEAKQWSASLQFIKHRFSAWCHREASVKTWGKSFHSCLSFTAHIDQCTFNTKDWHYAGLFSPTSCK